MQEVEMDLTLSMDEIMGRLTEEGDSHRDADDYRDLHPSQLSRIALLEVFLIQHFFYANLMRFPRSRDSDSRNIPSIIPTFRNSRVTSIIISTS